MRLFCKFLVVGCCVLFAPSVVSAQICPFSQTCGASCCRADEVCFQGACIAATSCTKDADCQATSFCAVSEKRCLPKVQTDPTCTYRPPIGKFSPAPLWEWKGSQILPTFKNVMMTPVVMALEDSDSNGVIDVKDMPSVIFMSYVSGGSYAEEGVVRALRGDTGKEIFTISDSKYRVNALGTLAVGDIDKDGKPDIVAPRYGGKSVWAAGLYAFTNTGKYKWVSHDAAGKVVPLPVGWGGASLTDLEGDGKVDVVIGNAVVRGSDGLVLCQGKFGNGSPDGRRPLSIPVDLDNDGKLEIVTGNTAYRSNCSVYWHNKNLGDGYVAVADMDQDGKPEVISLGAGTLRVINGQTGALLMSVAVPGGGGGPPTIADFDGDKKPDIASAGRQYYVIFSPDFTNKKLKLLWQFKTQDFSSSQTGSSVFDFEGDGKAEAVYNDEVFMRVFDGATGSVLYSNSNRSSTTLEYPVIVDVNNDGRSEIVFCSNNGTMSNIRVFRDQLDNWVDTRNVWNQHQYSVTNICTGDSFCPPGNKFGEIPKKQIANWTVKGLNNFRQNVQGKGLFEAADLVLKDLKLRRVGCTDKVELSLRLTNQGARKIPSKIPVTFYQGDPSGKNIKLQTLFTTRELSPGQHELLQVTLPLSVNHLSTYFAVADDDGSGQSTRNECNEKNNLASQNLSQSGAEICNGKDDDCDGQIDNNIPDKFCQGVCGRGKATCTNGAWSGCSGPQPEAESCDGKDNDCNGKIDDNLTRACKTACGAGVESCNGGSWVGCTATKPQQEVCDGFDNDCDGEVDKGATCPGTKKCVEGRCREVCIGGECAKGQRCENGVCIDVCQNTCLTGQTCDKGSCVPVCNVLTCPDGFVCKEAYCQPVSSRPDGSVNEVITDGDMQEPQEEPSSTDAMGGDAGAVVDTPTSSEKDAQGDASVIETKGNADLGGSGNKDKEVAPGGCGCQTTSTTQSVIWLWLGVVFFGLMRRREQGLVHR